MGAMFAQIITFITTVFSAAFHAASAVDHLTTWADEAAGTFSDVARHERQMKLQAMMKEAGISELPKAKASTKALSAPVAAPILQDKETA